MRTLTGRSADASPFGDRVEAMPLLFDDRAVENARRLFAAAREAGVRRFVHVSITNPREDSRLPCFKGKAVLERELGESGLPHSIVRPTVLFGGTDVLVNNIAFLLRRLPLFGVPGWGRYPIQPVHVADLADLLVAEADVEIREGQNVLEIPFP